jgi:hypothetical protein
MLGPLGESIFAPFKWSAPPTLTLSGRIEGGAHTTLHIDGRTTGEFRFQDFPLENVRFTADVRDNDVDVTQMEARLGEGTLTGRARVFGTGPARRVAFDYTLKDASLVRAVATLQDYTARKNRTPPSPPEKFLQEKAAVHLDLSAAAEGRYDDPLSYHGTGRATLQGPGLGEVQLLGLLSELLKFTALRFTSAKTTFTIDGAKLTFPDLAIRGANSAIDAAKAGAAIVHCHVRECLLPRACASLETCAHVLAPRACMCAPHRCVLNACQQPRGRFAVLTSAHKVCAAALRRCAGCTRTSGWCARRAWRSGRRCA